MTYVYLVDYIAGFPMVVGFYIAHGTACITYADPKFVSSCTNNLIQAGLELALGPRLDSISLDQKGASTSSSLVGFLDH
jgi:hypothetical protein